MPFPIFDVLGREARNKGRSPSGNEAGLLGTNLPLIKRMHAGGFVDWYD